MASSRMDWSVFLSSEAISFKIALDVWLIRTVELPMVSPDN
jgi:hypothetical protein